MSKGTSARIRVLFNTWANRNNINSQSLTAREIAYRLDPERFLSSLFLSWRQEPDPRLAERPNIRLLRVPPRLGSLFIAGQRLWGAHDIVFYPQLNQRASRLSQSLSGVGRPRRNVDCVETSLEQIEACPEAMQLSIFSSLRRADLRSSITPAIARELKKRYDLESLVIPLGVDLELFQPIHREDHQPPWRILYVASIQARKQTHLILELARRLRPESVDFQCIGPPLGDPSYFQQLLDEKARDGLENVTFLGPLSQQEINQQMSDADIYVLPSRLEGFGKTTLEAAGTGLPAVVFADYETTAVVDNVTGFQVETLDEMESALRRLVHHPELRQRMGQAAGQHAQDFSWDATARRWEKALIDLTRGSARI